MDKNYYEILEVDKNASPEIIDKAYRTLAKKYHPDLQDDIHKKEAEETFKIINEAYQTLSNPKQRALYDQKLEDTVVSQDKFDEMYQQNQVLKSKLNDLQQHIYNENTYSQSTNNFNDSTNINDDSYNAQNAYQNTQAKQYKRNLEYEQQVNQARQQAYRDAYIQDLKNRGYKIKYKKTFSDYVKSFISIIIVLFVLFLLWQIPFVKNYFINLYYTNSLVKAIGDVFINLFT